MGLTDESSHVIRAAAAVVAMVGVLTLVACGSSGSGSASRRPAAAPSTSASSTAASSTEPAAVPAAVEPGAPGPVAQPLPPASCSMVVADLTAVQRALYMQPTDPLPPSIGVLASRLQRDATRSNDPVAQQRIQQMADSLTAYLASGALEPAVRADAWTEVTTQVKAVVDACA